ncbi:MAG: ferredoxin [Nanoarchaeota archaeon]|nr:ferredoxin [Nanoarchaeota archaeon]
MAKIVHYRGKCIGCNSCVEHCPTFWKMDEDGKSTLIDAVDKGQIFVKQVDDAFLEENKKAEKDCPVHIIKVVE